MRLCAACAHFCSKIILVSSPGRQAPIPLHLSEVHLALFGAILSLQPRRTCVVGMKISEAGKQRSSFQFIPSAVLTALTGVPKVTSYYHYHSNQDSIEFSVGFKTFLINSWVSWPLPDTPLPWQGAQPGTASSAFSTAPFEEGRARSPQSSPTFSIIETMFSHRDHISKS